MAVKAPFGPTSAFSRAFSPVPDSPWPNSAMASTVPPNNMLLSDHTNRLSAAPPPPTQPEAHETALTPLDVDITAPSPSTSEASTVFTDVEGGEEEQDSESTTEVAPAQQVQVEESKAVANKSSPSTLTIDIGKLNTKVTKEEDDAPQSVIHVPSGFGRFHRSSNAGNKAPSRLSQSWVMNRPPSSLSQASITSGTAPSEANTASTATTESQITVVPNSAGSSAPSDSTVKEIEVLAPPVETNFYDSQMPPTPLQTAIPSANDWTSTPRAQTRQDLINFSRPGSSLASISENDDPEQSDAYTTDASVADRERQHKRKTFYRDADSEINALKTALSECWTLCNTLANLSHIHRERIFINHSGRGDMQEQAWKSCWKLCQTLYDTREEVVILTTRPTLDLCRDFCQALFEVRVRGNEAADSVLRVSFELNNHLYNTHDRNLPEAFRERTLDFYITLCHRLMKQKSNMAEETDTLLRACWSLAEMLFSLRQSKRENRKPDEELLGSAVQACWELCDLFREGWTQIRPERGTPRPSQARTTTFTQAFHQAKKAGYIDEQGNLKLTPETPTTIFDDTATISPEEAPVPNIVVMPSEQHLGVPQSATSTASAPPALPRPNSTQRMSRAGAPVRQNRWNSINAIVSEDESESGAIEPASAISRTSRASSTHMSIASSQHTVRTPSEDPSLTLMKALFIRAAVQSGRGFSPDPRAAAGRDTTYSSLPLFARSLPDTAFGTQVWQRNLLDNYRKAIAQDSSFKHMGSATAAIGLGTDPEKGKEEIATVLRGMVSNTYGWGWLRDLFRYGYGSTIDDVINRTKTGPTTPAAKERSTSVTSARSAANGSTNILGGGNEGRKITRTNT